MSTEEKIARENIAGENLTEHMAEKDIEEDWTGDIGEATVVDIQTEFDDTTMMAEFEVELPDNSTGYLRFSEFSDHVLEKFLEDELRTTHTEMNVIMRKFPVVKTQYGWEAKIGDAPFDYIFEPNNESRIFTVSDIGMIVPKPSFQYLAFLLLALPAFEFGLSWIPFSFVASIPLILFIYVPIAVMLAPRARDVKEDSIAE